MSTMSTSETRWLQWLRAACLVVLVTGLLPVFAAVETTQEPWRLFFDVLTWPIDGLPRTFASSERQLSAVLGGVLCGWAWLLYRLAQPQVFNSRIRTLMVQSTWTWFLIDSGGSILSGIPLNAGSNVGFLLMLLIPLNALKSVK